MKGKGFAIIGMTVDQGDRKDIDQAVKKFELSYPVALADSSVQEAYGGIRAVPTKFLLDKKGSIRAHYEGVVDENRLRADVESLLKE